MKTEIEGKQSTASKNPYPVMKGKDFVDGQPRFIVLFTAPSTGICIRDPEPDKDKNLVGKPPRNNWEECLFDRLENHIQVHLSNG
jgi:hypothetical protein